MKSFLKFLVVFSAILLGSAVLAPWLFDFLPFKFERIFNRLVMIFTLAAAIFFVRIRKSTVSGYGLAWDKDSLSYFLKAFFSGLLILSAFAVLRIATGFGALSLKDLSAAGWAIAFVKITFSAVLIGVIEEFFFRGFIFKTFCNWKWAVPAAAAATSFFYSIVHFVDHKKPYIGADPSFKDSLKLILAPFVSFVDWAHIWPGVLGLFIFGLILNDLSYRTRSLYPAIGLHAGCVFFVKFDGFFVDFLDTRSLWWGGNKVYDGVIGWGFLALLFLVTRLLIKERQSETSIR
jgi:hypothetical protein